MIIVLCLCVFVSHSSYTIVLIYYAFCLVLMMLLRPLLVKKIACGLGKSERFRSVYAALYFFPILTVLQAVGGGLLCECSLVSVTLATLGILGPLKPLSSAAV